MIVVEWQTFQMTLSVYGSDTAEHNERLENVRGCYPQQREMCVSKFKAVNEAL